MNKAELGELSRMTVEELGWCARKVVSQQRVTCAWDGGLSSAMMIVQKWVRAWPRVEVNRLPNVQRVSP